MKHLLSTLLTVALLAVALPAGAQSIQVYGVKGGLSSATHGGGFADLYERLDGDVGRRTGITLGGFLQFAPESLPFVLQPEALFTMKGSTLGGSGLVEREINMNYLDIPVLARFDFDAESVMPFVVAGPVLGILVGSSGEREGVEIEVDDELKSTDFGLAIGAGVALDQLDVELRYTHGLINVTQSDDEDESAKNRWIGLVVGYKLGGSATAARRNR